MLHVKKTCFNSPYYQEEGNCLTQVHLENGVCVLCMIDFHGMLSNQWHENDHCNGCMQRTNFLTN